jgi:predicted flavoprotein YhiN
VDIDKCNLGKETSQQVFDHVIVIGSGIAGLLTAASMSFHAKKVFIIELKTLKKNPGT